MNIVDLHVHSNKSDGSFTPTELVHYAIQKGLSAFALTDHDTTDGIDEAIEAAKGKNIEIIPGIEFSSEYEGKDIHIVGLYIDYKSDFFKRRLQNFVNGRIIRNREMCKRLTDYGFPVTYEELMAEFPDCVITRSHYAKFMLNHGYTKTLKEAFDRYIGDNCPCFVPRKKITPMRAVEIILKAGGFPVLAHPLLYHLSSQKLDKLVSYLKDMGLQGLEAVYSTHSSSDERQMRVLAAKYDLCISGGSDFHGNAKPGLDLATGYGKLFIPQEILDKINERRKWMAAHPEQIKPTKILFTDLDGTLLDSQKQISPYTREVLEKWSQAGHKLALCSGRDINSVKDVKRYLRLELPNMYVIGYNGGQIYDCTQNKTIHRAALTLDQTAHILEEADKCGVHVHTYTETNIVSPKDDEELVYYKRVIKTPIIINPNVMDVLTEGPCKCIGIELKDADKLEHFRLSLLSWAEDEGVSMIYSSPYYLEFFPATSGKGVAVKTLCELLGINPYFSVAAGDAQNDLSMIEAAGMGIAMLNGSEDVQMAATIITAYDNDHDGLAHALVDLI
ncbi:Cof-type HAD-IIB family hydrolase [Parablautia muri]|uniref:Cof-type HAD-IIB family hydrolase n=1 Tax=Parablautia muri TaxID=2320879 RepID=A0A9X5BII7_9FIRM|nr:Cof-type HAD-IIB family hydrolase [Parablautia muri]